MVIRLQVSKISAEAKQQMIELAKQTGTWEALVDVQNSVVPKDLQQLLNKNKVAKKNFEAFPPSSKRIILEWILNAKKQETRKQGKSALTKRMNWQQKTLKRI